MEHEIVQLEHRRDDHGDVMDILRDSLPRMRSRDADSPHMPTLRNNDNPGFGAGGGGLGANVNNNDNNNNDEEEDDHNNDNIPAAEPGWKRLQFGELYHVRRAQAEARYDADDVSLADSDVTGTTGRTGLSDEDDETVSVDSYMSHPSSFDAFGGGGGGGARRVSQMSHRKASASFRTFEAAGIVDGGSAGTGGGGGAGTSGESGGVTYGEYVGVGVGLCLLLMFSYLVQYLVRHGVIVAPTVRIP